MDATTYGTASSSSPPSRRAPAASSSAWAVRRRPTGSRRSTRHRLEARLRGIDVVVAATSRRRSSARRRSRRAEGRVGQAVEFLERRLEGWPRATSLTTASTCVTSPAPAPRRPGWRFCAIGGCCRRFRRGADRIGLDDRLSTPTWWSRRGLSRRAVVSGKTVAASRVGGGRRVDVLVVGGEATRAHRCWPALPWCHCRCVGRDAAMADTTRRGRDGRPRLLRERARAPSRDGFGLVRQWARTVAVDPRAEVDLGH